MPPSGTKPIADLATNDSPSVDGLQVVRFLRGLLHGHGHSMQGRVGFRRGRPPGCLMAPYRSPSAFGGGLRFGPPAPTCRLSRSPPAVSALRRNSKMHLLSRRMTPTCPFVARNRACPLVTHTNLRLPRLLTDSPSAHPHAIHRATGPISGLQALAARENRATRYKSRPSGGSRPHLVNRGALGSRGGDHAQCPAALVMNFLQQPDLLGTLTEQSPPGYASRNAVVA